MNAPTWTDEQDEYLKQCLTIEGMTYEEACASLNRKFRLSKSRSSCIGRGHRLGIEKKSKTPPKAAPEKTSAPKPWDVEGITRTDWYKKRRANAAKAGIKPELLLGRPNLKSQPQELAPLRSDPVEPLRIDIMDLTDATCRWPVGGWPSPDPITFCGHLPKAGEVYCPAHMLLKRPHDPRTGVELSPEARAARIRGSTAKIFTCTNPALDEAAA